MNHGRISETFTNYEAKDLLRNRLSVGGAWIMSQNISDNKLRLDLRNLHELRGKRLVARLGMGGAWIMSYHILDDKSRSGLRNLHEYRGKRLVARVSQTRGFALYLRTGVVLMLQSESSWYGRSVDHVLTYFERQIAVGSQKPSRIMRQKTCCASESNTSVRVVLANRSGFDAPIGVVLAWEGRGSCLNIFRSSNRGRISETFTNHEAKDSLRK
ncbi:uncharacterized protein G2W53_010025 [Senna tora]|uniref:Uncharacterized protein n=1 Tax=Senna tora TaxID=362788 RepID=A0A835C8U3_9FABA|nr:uncharacterized protein G2W53_010025 [Senna tora]